MVMDDKLSGCLKAHRVEGEGRTDTWIAKRMVTHIADIEHGEHRIVAKCDHESPIKAVQDDIIRGRSDGMTVPKHNCAGDSNSNRRIEVANKVVMAQIRTFWLMVQARAKVKLTMDHDMFDWCT